MSRRVRTLGRDAISGRLEFCVRMIPGTLREKGAQCGVSASTLSRVAAGRRPDVLTLARLCSASGMSTDWVLGVAPTHAPTAELLRQHADALLSLERAARAAARRAK